MKTVYDEARRGWLRHKSRGVSNRGTDYLVARFVMFVFTNMNAVLLEMNDNSHSNQRVKVVFPVPS